jgi:hypothetical protein
MSDPLDELFSETPEAAALETPAPEPVAPVEPAAADPGKGEPPAAPPAAPDDRDQRIPITALLDEREKRQAAERRAQEIERRLAEIEAQKAPKPDFYDNPEAVIAAERAQVQQMLFNERLNMSEMVERQRHGDELVGKATEAFMAAAGQNPALAMELQRQSNPYGFVVSWHKKQQALAEIGDDPAAYRERLREQLRAEMMAQPLAPAAPAQVQPKPTPPPRSMAAHSGVTGAANVSPGSAFDELFPR